MWWKSALPVPEGYSAANTAKMIFDGGKPPSEGVNEGKVLRFRFSPRDAKVWSYVIESNFAGLDGKTGKVTAVPPPLGARANHPRCIPIGGLTILLPPLPRGCIPRKNREPVAQRLPARLCCTDAPLQIARDPRTRGRRLRPFSPLGCVRAWQVHR